MELTYGLKEVFDNKQFIDDKKVIIDVKKMKRGVKIIHLDYVKTNEKNMSEIDSKTERVMFVN